MGKRVHQIHITAAAFILSLNDDCSQKLFANHGKLWQMRGLPLWLNEKSVFTGLCRLSACLTPWLYRQHNEDDLSHSYKKWMGETLFNSKSIGTEDPPSNYNNLIACFFPRYSVLTSLKSTTAYLICMRVIKYANLSFLFCLFVYCSDRGSLRWG